MVFWAANPAAAGKTGVENMDPDTLKEDSMLMGFTVGDESTVPTLKITDVEQPVALQNGKTQGSHCIGCHTGTPDGDYVAFVDAWPWGAAFAGVKPGLTGAALPGFTGGPCTDWNNCEAPKTFVQYPWNGPMTFSPAHWAFDDFGRADRDHRDAGPGHHDAVGTGIAELAAGPARLGRSEVDRDDDDERSDQSRPAASRSDYLTQDR